MAYAAESPVGSSLAILALLRDNIRCVVLNSCHSEGQAEAIAEHIDRVVGMTSALGDEAAIRFASGFYEALAYGRDVQTAFGLGTSRIDLEGLGEEDTLQLVAKRVPARDVAFADPTERGAPGW